MKRIVTAIALTIAVFVALSTAAFAHGKEKHVMGTVTNISGNTVTVETTAKKSVTVELSDKTQFHKSGAPSSLKELKVGDKVVIHAEPNGEKLVASDVRFGAEKAEGSMQGMKGMDQKKHGGTKQQ